MRSRNGTPLPEPYETCYSIDNIAELQRSALERLSQEMENNFDDCNYTLGEGMFLELYGSLGDTAFRQGFSNLYLLLRDNTLRDECPGIDFSACYMKAAFVTGATPKNAAIAEGIITQRYYGSP